MVVGVRPDVETKSRRVDGLVHRRITVPDGVVSKAAASASGRVVDVDERSEQSLATSSSGASAKGTIGFV